MPSKQDNKLKLLWLQGVTCNGNTHSFLNLQNIEQLLNKFEILYIPAFSTNYTIDKIVKCSLDCDILIFEGAYDPFMKRAGVNLKELLFHYMKDSKQIIALGSCASFGGVFKESAPDRITGLLFNENTLTTTFLDYKDKIINLSGCPIHPEWLAYVLNMLLKNINIELDDLYRPIELYSTLAHHGCTRNEYFEWKIDAKKFGLKEGCLFYKQGCRAPMTHSSCNKILWNDESSKTRVGTPCFGCTEPDFPRDNLFQTKTNMSIPQDIPVGVPKRSYLTMAGIAKTFHIKRLEGKLIDYKTDS